MAKDEGFNCCGQSAVPEDAKEDCDCVGRTAEQAGGCIVQNLEDRIIPCGTRKMAGQEREYRTTTQQWLTRLAFIAWSKDQGKELDPICWFSEMGHGPVPADVQIEM